MKNNNDIQEVWKTIKDYPNYQVSNTGKVKSPKCILKPSLSNRGYFRVTLYRNNHPKIYSLHRLVAEYFIPNPNNYPQVNHIDGNKQNNNVDNLEWCTASYNIQHAFAKDLMKPPKAKLVTLLEEKEIKFLYKGGKTIKEIAKIYDIKPDTIKTYVKGIIKNRPIPKSTKLEIKRLIETGLYSVSELSDLFDVKVKTIYNIKNEKLKA